MTEIMVEASKVYPVYIGSGAWSHLSEVLADRKRVCIITDHNVWDKYEQTIKSKLPEGCAFCASIVPPGENSKKFQTLLPILDYIAENRLTRDDCIIALGGGVIGDLAGFAAAIYLRGIPYIQVPTTLLAMVDSSVGGKTGIDLPAGKNLCGAFYQPEAVLCDPDTLSTLPMDVFRDGCAEVIKYAILFDPDLFVLLEKTGLDFPREEVIARCIRHKRDVVVGDEFDRGQRMLLNFGHTIGHAIESCSNYTITHGQAVAIGMAMVCRASKCPDTDRIVGLLKAFGLPTATDFSVQSLWEAACKDKKRSGDAVNLIIPKTIGHCEIVPTSTKDLKTFIEEGM